MDQQPIAKENIHLDRDRCIGAGMCESVSPSAFRVDDEGLVEFAPALASSGAGPLDLQLNLAVARAEAVCPARAIRVQSPKPEGADGV